MNEEDDDALEGRPAALGERPFDGLEPDVILGAVESLGMPTGGGFLALNSYENRVYQVSREDAPPLIVKFYRPLRWSDEAIVEEHGFALELAELEIPVAPPLLVDGRSLHSYAGFRFAAFERRRGGWPDMDTRADRMQLGRFLGRIHAVGAIRAFRHRPGIDVGELGEQPLEFLLAGGFIGEGVEAAYEAAARDVLAAVRHVFADAGRPREIRLHGDCHPGNILWSDEGPCFVDLDDARNGPAIQDLWMLLSGERDEMATQLTDLIDGYRTFHDFDSRQLVLIEALRGLRMVYYSGWLARRWDDPAFPLAFPWFATRGYWQEQVHVLREQMDRIALPPLWLD